jgi:hypothetical protein
VGYQGHDIIGCMNITFYPSLTQALDSLKDNECLYSTYSLVIKVKYNKKLLGYEPKSIVKEEDESGKFLPKNTEYVHLLFRKRALVDLVRDLTSVIDKNERIFKPPLREAIDLGLKEITESEKEFIYIGYIPSSEYKDREVLIEKNIELVREPIVKAIEREPWRKSFLGFGNIREKVEKEIEKLIRKNDYKYWNIGIVSNEIGNGVGRVIAKSWKKERVLGLETGLRYEMKELEKILGEISVKFGENHVRSIFPEVLLTIYFGLEENEKEPEIIVVPFREEGTGQAGKRETGKMVNFLVLKKTKLTGGKTIRWVPIKLDYITSGFFEGFPRAVIRPSNFEVSLSVTGREQRELSTKEGKTFINIWSQSFREIEVISDEFAKDKKLGERDLAVERITYTGKVHELKQVEVDINKENLNVEVKKYEKKKRGVSEEKLWIRAYSGKAFTKNKRCLEESAIELIKKELEKIITNTKTYEKGERDIDKKRGIRLSSIILKRTLETLDKKEKREINCETLESVNKYKILPTMDKEYKPISEEKELIKIINSSTFGPSIVKKTKEEVELLEILNNGSLCLIIEGIKKEIDMFRGMIGNEESVEVEEKVKEMRSLGRETYYVKYLSDQLIEVSHKSIDDSWKYPKDLTGLRKEIREADELSIKLSNIIASAIELPEYRGDRLPDEKVTKKIADEVVKRIYRGFLFSLIDGPYLNWKTILESLVGVEIDSYFDEKISIRLPTKNEKFGYKVQTSLERKILKPGSTNVEDVSVSWPVMYMDPGLEGKLIRIKVEYINR